MLRLARVVAIIVLLFITIPSLAAVPANSSERARSETSFDAGWLFNKGEAEGAQVVGFADTGWEKVDVPHDWSIAGPYAEDAPARRGGGYLPSGISWYRKHFTVPNSAGKRVYLHFEGIMANAEVWVNGKSVGKRPYGYSPQHYDITEHLVGGNNVVAVRTDTTVQPASRWYTGQGIYRHVKLIVQDPVHIENFSTYITTPGLIYTDFATVKIQNSVVNKSDAVKNVIIHTTLLGPDGQPAGNGATESKRIEPGQSASFEQEIRVANPKLWDLESPNLYKAVSKVQADNMTLDEQIASFGIRTAEFRAETGFWLNGKNIKLTGVCMHHDGGGVGAAVPLRVHERRLEILKSIGVNAVRTAHNPVNPDYLDLCDRMGILVMEETFDTWTASKPNAERGYQLHFNDWWERDTRDMITRDRNHPSVIIWSIGNEIRDNLNNPEGRKRMTDQLDLVHKLDSTRPVTMGLFRPSANSPYLDLLDVIGSNYNPRFLLTVRQNNPARKTTVTEESHGVPNWVIARDTPAIAGTFIWSGFDYLGETAEAGSWPYVVSSSGSDGFGIFEHTGYPRARADQRRSWWTTQPMVAVWRHLGHEGVGPLVHDWTPADPGTFDKARVQVFTNTEEAELFLNDTSLGSKPKNANATPIVFDFDYQPGTLKVVGKNGGQVVTTHELKTADEPSKLAAAADRTTIRNEFDDVSHVIVTAKDEKGVVNPNFTDAVTFKIEGPGKLIATSTGDRTSHQSFASPTRKAFHGQVMAIIRATADSGTITVTATAEGVAPTTITLQAGPASQAR